MKWKHEIHWAVRLQSAMTGFYKYGDQLNFPVSILKPTSYFLNRYEKINYSPETSHANSGQMFNISETCFASIIWELLPHFSFQLMRLVASGNIITFGIREIVKSSITLNDFQTGCNKSLFLGNLKFLRRVMLLHVYGWVTAYSPSPEAYREAAWRTVVILITNGAALLLKFYQNGGQT